MSGGIAALPLKKEILSKIHIKDKETKSFILKKHSINTLSRRTICLPISHSDNLNEALSNHLLINQKSIN
jgi:hypothetical protein